MKTSEQIDQLATALAKAQGELENASKNSSNPHFRSKYADLAEVLNTVRPVFSRHGLSIVQSPSYSAETGIVSVTTILMHASGQWIQDTASAPATKLDAQGVGSCITYLRRYSAAAFAACAQEDDDANSAVGHAKKAPSKHELEAAVTMLRSCTSLDELKTAYASLNADMRQALTSVKDEMKDKLS